MQGGDTIIMCSRSGMCVYFFGPLIFLGLRVANYVDVSLYCFRSCYFLDLGVSCLGAL